MKKLIGFILCVCLILILAACSTESNVPNTSEPNVTEATLTQESESIPEETTLPEGVKTARRMLDRPIDELIAILGEPERREYLPSSLIDGKDGILYYDGFIVYTLLYENGNEFVQYAE